MPKKPTEKTKNKNAAGDTSYSSKSTQSSSSSLDFLGRPPSHSQSSGSSSTDFLGKPTRHSSAETDHTSTQSSSTQSNKSPQRKNKKHPRKQLAPKKRKDRITPEIVRLQKTTNVLIPKLPFQRLLREILQQFKINFRYQTEAVVCLQEATEAYVIGIFEDAYLCCLHRQRVTLDARDIKLTQFLRHSHL